MPLFSRFLQSNWLAIAIYLIFLQALYINASPVTGNFVDVITANVLTPEEEHYHNTGAHTDSARPLNDGNHEVDKAIDDKSEYRPAEISLDEWINQILKSTTDAVKDAADSDEGLEELKAWYQEQQNSPAIPVNHLEDVEIRENRDMSDAAKTQKLSSKDILDFSAHRSDVTSSDDTTEEEVPSTGFGNSPPNALENNLVEIQFASLQHPPKMTSLKKDYVKRMSRAYPTMTPRQLSVLTASICYLTSYNPRDAERAFQTYISRENMVSLATILSWEVEQVQSFLKFYFAALGQVFVTDTLINVPLHPACHGDVIPRRKLLKRFKVGDVFMTDLTAIETPQPEPQTPTPTAVRKTMVQLQLEKLTDTSSIPKEKLNYINQMMTEFKLTKEELAILTTSLCYMTFFTPDVSFRISKPSIYYLAEKLKWKQKHVVQYFKTYASMLGQTFEIDKIVKIDAHPACVDEDMWVPAGGTYKHISHIFESGSATKAKDVPKYMMRKVNPTVVMKQLKWKPGTGRTSNFGLPAPGKPLPHFRQPLPVNPRANMVDPNLMIEQELEYFRNSSLVPREKRTFIETITSVLRHQFTALELSTLTATMCWKSSIEAKGASQQFVVTLKDRDILLLAMYLNRNVEDINQFFHSYWNFAKRKPFNTKTKNKLSHHPACLNEVVLQPTRCTEWESERTVEDILESYFPTQPLMTTIRRSMEM